MRKFSFCVNLYKRGLRGQDSPSLKFSYTVVDIIVSYPSFDAQLQSLAQYYLDFPNIYFFWQSIKLVAEKCTSMECASRPCVVEKH